MGHGCHNSELTTHRHNHDRRHNRIHHIVVSVLQLLQKLL